ncbi:MAG: radical SAM protein, partial [Clostridia bacterium]|nr:radical SAM protein [Clostridia bacterium]
FRLRFMTSHPKDASDRLIEVMASEPKAAKHFHLPVQSGSDRILKAMNRKYTAEKYLERIEKIRSTVPDVSLTSDIIVGFPGETEDDFARTLAMMEKARYDMVFSFIYSPRTGTPAASMPDQIPREVSSGRMERLLALGAKIADERNERFVGRTLRILAEDVSKNDPDMLTGRGDPVRPIHFAGDRSLIGQFARVKITAAKTYCLEGELV